MRLVWFLPHITLHSLVKVEPYLQGWSLVKVELQVDSHTMPGRAVQSWGANPVPLPDSALQVCRHRTSIRNHLAKLLSIFLSIVSDQHQEEYYTSGVSAAPQLLGRGVHVKLRAEVLAE